VANKEQREQFERYKEDVKKRGKPFYPYAMFHDTVMSFVVVCVIAGLAAVWHFTASEEAGDAGWLGPRYAEEADPGTTSFVPRPDWYFYFLFYLLRIFKWPESVILGTVGIPTVLIILLLALPFVDRRTDRRLLRRPVAIVAALLVIASMGILTYKGATAEEPSATSGRALLEGNGITTEDAQTIQGANLFATVGCLNCHTYGDQGAAGPGPNISNVYEQGRSVEYWTRWVSNPQEVKPGTAMPGFPNLTDDQLTAIGTFLNASPDGG
jgi:ubiquinol-cytochrome c reductase cytochrome b subunit/menaquinol-cytochrome c reductase cytochrome b/c subunit